MMLGRIIYDLCHSLQCSFTVSILNRNARYSYRAINTSCKFSVASKYVETIVNPLCTIKVESFQCNVAIKPTDPDEYKNSDRLLTQIDDSHRENIAINVVHRNEDNVIVKIQNSCDDGMVGECLLQVPVQSGITLLCHGNSSAKIQDMQGENVFVSCEQGNIDTKNIRGSQIELHADSGDIICKGVLQGNTKLRTSSKGAIICQRLQGRSVHVNTEAGDVKLESCYSDESHVSSNSGNIRLENLHRKCNISVKGHGNLFVSGLDGCIDARIENGSADIQLSKLQDNSSIKSNSGNVKIRVTDSTNCRLHLEGENVVTSDFTRSKQDDVIGKISSFVIGNDTKAHILKVLCPNGTIELIKASWISTLNLGGKK